MTEAKIQNFFILIFFMRENNLFNNCIIWLFKFWCLD